MLVEILIALGGALAVGGSVALFDRWKTRPPVAPDAPPDLTASPYRRPVTPSTPADPATGGYPAPPSFDDD